MADKPTGVDEYLKRLREELEVLGPSECDEVVSDVRSLLGDAVAEHGDETAALESFGTPEDLARRMLEERTGSGQSLVVPRAAWWLRAGAMAVDVAILLWGAQLTFGLASVAFVASWSWGSVAMVVGGIALGLCSLALLGMYAILVVASRRQSGGETFGMQLFGLKYVRVGADGRIVRVRDIPGARREWRAGTIIVTVFAVLALYSMGQWFVKWPSQNAASAAHRAVNMAGESVSVVSEAYRSVLSGNPDESEGSFSSSGESARRALVARRSSGKLVSYTVSQVELDRSYDGGIPDEGPTSYYVNVWEYGRQGAESGVTYRYHVVTTWKPSGPNISEGRTVVDSVERTE
jgi:uncharacterized membrane protein